LNLYEIIGIEQIKYNNLGSKSELEKLIKFVNDNKLGDKNILKV